MAKGKMTEGEWLERPAKIAKAAQKAKKKAGPKGADHNKDYAFILYMQKASQGDIAERCGVSQQTVSAWKTAGEWEAKRAAQSISINELIAKTLQKANGMLDAENFNADAFAKAIAQLKTLKTGNTVDDEITCFMAFQTHLIEQRGIDSSADEDFLKELFRMKDHKETIAHFHAYFIKRLVRLQDSYIKIRMGNV